MVECPFYDRKVSICRSLPVMQNLIISVKKGFCTDLFIRLFLSPYFSSTSYFFEKRGIKLPLRMKDWRDMKTTDQCVK